MPATVINHVNTYGDVKKSWYHAENTWPPGTCAGERLTRVVKGQVTTQTFVKESRPKPAVPVLSPTSQGPQHLIRNQYGILEKFVKTNETTGLCTARQWIWLREEMVALTQEPVIVWDEPDWAQALRLKIMSREVSYAENLGEYREAVQYVKDGASILKRAWNTARYLWRQRGNRKNIVKRLVKSGAMGQYNKYGLRDPKVVVDVLGAHLAIQFGILPTIGILEDTMIQMNQTRVSKRLRIQVTVPGTGYGRLAGTFSGEAVCHGKVSKRAIAYIKLKDGIGDYTAGNLGEAIWAGTRLSFMLDWFIDVGSYLKALNTLTSVDSIVGTVTTRRIASTVDTRVPNSPWYLKQPGKIEHLTTWRDVFTSVPLPSRVNMRLPSNWGQLVSSVEILLTMRNRA